MWTFVKAALLMIKQEEVYKIGILGKPHGVRGEIQFRFTDDVFDQCDAEYFSAQHRWHSCTFLL